MRLHLRNPLTRTDGGCKHQHDDDDVDGDDGDEDVDIPVW